MDARRRRQTRRLVLGFVTACVTLIAGIVAALAMQPHPLVVATAPTSDTTGTTEAVVAPETASSTPPSPPPSSTTPSSAPTTTRPRFTTTTAPTRTTTTAPDGDCPSSALSTSTVTDKASYAAGTTVTITIRVTNRSDQPCDRPFACMSRVASVVDASNALVWDQPHGPPGACAFFQPTPLAPGETYDYATVAWDQHSCTDSCADDFSGQTSEGAQVPTGTYRAVGHVFAADGGQVDGSGPAFSIT